MGHVVGVVAGLALHVHVPDSQAVGRIAHELDAVRIEALVAEAPAVHDLDVDVAPPRTVADRGLDVGQHALDAADLRVPEVDAHLRELRQDPHRVGPDLDLARSALAALGVVLPADVVHRRDQVGGAHQRVPALVHRRRTAVRGLAGDPQPHAAGGVPVGDHADGDALGLQDRPLLDVQLEVRVDVAAAHLGLADVADLRQRAAVGDAVVVGAGVRPLEIAQAREDGGSQHRRVEAGALLVRPVHHLDGTAGLDAVIVEGAKDLEPGQHSEDSVEPAAGVLRVEVAPHQHRRGVVLAPGAAREDVAHPVDGHLRAHVPAPGNEEVPHLLVRRIERQPAQALVPSRPDAGRRHHGVPQPIVIDLQEVGAVVHGHFAPGCGGSNVSGGVAGERENPFNPGNRPAARRDAPARTAMKSMRQSIGTRHGSASCDGSLQRRSRFFEPFETVRLTQRP